MRIHGRGGQGVVTAAEMLSIAAFREGQHAQAFPSFGSERTGAPVVAFCRIDDKPIRLREPIVEPDALIIQDPTLLHQVDVFGGLDAGGYILDQHRRERFDELGLDELVERFRAERLLTVPATELALRARSAARCRTPPCSAGSPRSPAWSRSSRSRGDPREVPRRGRRTATSPRRADAYELRATLDGDADA